MIDVAIIGCGPTGAFLGNLLGSRGLQVSIFEKQPEIFDLPRAVHFDGEAMRLFQSAGLADAILPTTRVNPGMLFKDDNGKTLVDWSRDVSIGQMGWHESYRFHQPDLERQLRNALRRFANVKLSTGVSVQSLVQDNDGVTLVTQSGHERARFAVICDGAGSTFRGDVADTLNDLGFEERWLVVDLILKRDRPDLGDYSIQYCNAHAPATYVRGVGQRRRWECRISDDDPNSFEPEQIWDRLARWITPRDATLERSAVYTFRSQVARNWSNGRLFLAGDAAHQMPPFMGQGMCAGLRDAGNLAWKLASVCSGADPQLLDSYESERDPNARAFIERSVKLGQLINQTAHGQQPKGKMNSIWPALGPGLGADDPMAGHLVPQIERSDDTAPIGFYAFVRETLGLPIPEIKGAKEWLDANNVFGVIVRPDFYALASAPDKDSFWKVVQSYSKLFQTVPARHFTRP